MQMHLRTLLISLVLALSGAAAVAEDTAQAVVQATVSDISREIGNRRAELTADRRMLYALIDERLLPKFDTDYAGRLVLGKSWRNATPVQRERFVDAFYNFLLRSYATAVLKFEENQVRVFPARVPPKDGRTVVETEMRLPDGGVVPVSYAMRTTPQGWKAYDVRIEGVSYVQNYRNQFNAEVAARGLDALIERLERDTADIDAGRKAPSGPGTANAGRP